MVKANAVRICVVVDRVGSNPITVHEVPPEQVRRGAASAERRGGHPTVAGPAPKNRHGAGHPDRASA